MSDEINPLAQPPVYEHDQVLTRKELVGMLLGFEWQYQRARWWDIKARVLALIAMQVMAAVIGYLDRGKR